MPCKIFIISFAHFSVWRDGNQVKQFYLNLPEIASTSLPRSAMVFAVAVAVFLLSILLVPRKHLLRSKRVAHDLLYYVFYNSVLSIAFLFIPLRRLIFPVLRILDYGLLAAFTPVPRFVIYFVAADLLSYWHHRWMHTRWLWPFHAVHHEQRAVTVFTSARKHLVEAVASTAALLMLGAILGNPPADTIWFLAVRYAKDATLHSGLKWRYGPLYWFVASPLFHSTHHSAEEEESNHNFGAFFSLWDMLFRTHRNSFVTPKQQGVHGLVMPSLWSQFWMPLKMTRQGVAAAVRANGHENVVSSPVGANTQS